MLHAEPFETHLLSAELCILFIYFLKGNCIGLEYHIILSKIHIIVIIKTKIIDQNKSCSNTSELEFLLTSLHARLYQNIVECTRASSERLYILKCYRTKLNDKSQHERFRT